MALQLNDRVKESSITTGVVPIVLAGSPTGYQNIASSISTSNTFPYVIELIGGSEWEIGVGQYITANNSIIRTQILNSSNSSNIVNFSAGTKNVFISVPAAYMALTAKDLSQFASTTSLELAGIISDETGSGKLVFSNNAVLVTPNIGVANGTSLNVTGNLNSNTVLVGPATSANLTRFPNALTVISNTAVAIQQNENHNIGLLAEGVANASNSSIYGVGVYGVGYTNSGTRSGGVVGEGHVTSSSDGGSAIGVRGYANDIHSGGLNVGLYGDALNSSIGNYALAMNNGNILSNFAQTWYLNGGLTFTGGANTVTIPNLVSSNAYFSSANGTTPFTVVSNTIVSNLNADFLDGQHGTYYTGLTGTAFSQANTALTVGQSAFGQANLAYTQANTALTVGQSAFAAANTAGSLVATNIKTANGYVAIKNDLVRCNTAAGAFSVSFPATPSDGDIIGVIDISNTFGINNLTLLPNTKFIESDSTSYILDINGAYVSFIYNTSTTNWRLLETPNTLSSGGTLSISTGVSTNINGLLSGDGTTLSGVTLKTINGNSLIGSGDITITGGSGGSSGFETNFLLMGA